MHLLWKTHDINDLTLDHVHPRHLGGKDETHNLVCSCVRCNQEKGTNNWKQFIQQHGLNPKGTSTSRLHLWMTLKKLDKLSTHFVEDVRKSLVE